MLGMSKYSPPVHWQDVDGLLFQQDAGVEVNLHSHVVEVARQLWSREPVLLEDRPQLDDLHVVVVVFWTHLDQGLASFPALLAGVLRLLRSPDHEAVVVLEDA